MILKKSLKHFILASVLLELLSADAFAITTNWNVASGSWDVPGNWSAGVPTAADTANIANNGQSTIGLGVNAAANSVAIGLGAQSGTLSINSGGTLTTSGVSLNTGSPSLIFNGGTLKSAANTVLLTNIGGTVTLNPNGAVIDSNGFNASISGVLSGSGGLTKVGLGTLTSLSPSTYTGDTTISAGTFKFAGSGGVAGQIINNSNLVFQNIAPVFQFGLISGTGTVTTFGNVVFANNNTYTGLTTISPGGGSFLQLGNNGPTGNVAGDILNNGGLVFVHTASITYGGAISGPGNVSVIATFGSTTTLTGNSTYTGNTILNLGTLMLGNGGTAGGSLSSDIRLESNSTLIFNRSDNFTYGKIISNLGQVIKQNTNTLIFTGDHTYNGLTTISGGTLQLGNGGTTGSVAGGILDNGILAFDRSDNLTFGQVTTGTGGVTKLNTNTLLFTGNNTYAGLTTIVGGILQLGNGGSTGSVAGDILDNASLIIDRSNTYTYNKVISGTGTLTKQGAGTLVLNGTNTFTGDTTINNGSVLLGDVSHPAAAVGGNAIVNMGGTLAGFGTVGGSLTNSGGIVSPGNSIGTITVLGNYVQSPTGSYIVQVDQAGNSDLLNITGTATLDGIVGISAINNGFLRRYPYTILTAGGGVIGTFSNPNIDNIFNQGFLRGEVLYFPNMVQFIVDYNDALFVEAAGTPNERAVAEYILATGGTPAVQALIASIFSVPQFQAAMDQLSGATYANNDVMLTRVGNGFSGELADRFDAFPSCNCRTSLLPGGGRRGCDQKNQFWVAGHGAEQDIKSGQVSGLNTNVGSLALGYEWAGGRNGKVGVAVSYSDFVARAQVREMSRTTGSLYQLGLYGRTQMGNWLLGAAVDAGVTTDLETERRIEGAMALAMTKGRYKAHLYSEQVRLGYDVTGNRPMRFSPFVGMIGQQLNRNHFAEMTTTGFELNVDGSNYRSTRSQVGAMLEVPTSSPFKPFISADWEHEFSDVNGAFNANFVGLGGKLHIEGEKIGKNSALVKAGTVIACGRNWNVAALYQGWYGSGWQENGGTLEATVAFG